MEKEYVQMMLESLQKKKVVLETLVQKCEEQKSALMAEDVDWDTFDALTEEKGNAIDELNRLDDGFEALFEKIKEPLTRQKDSYKAEIGLMQSLIKNLTEMSTQIETLEHRNKSLMEKRIAESRQAVKQSKLGTKAAAEYYQRMNRINMIDPQLMDKKS